MQMLEVEGHLLKDARLKRSLLVAGMQRLKISSHRRIANLKRHIGGRRGLTVDMATFTTTSESNLPNLSPARPHYGPNDFTRILRALSGLLEACPGLQGRVLE